MGWIIWIETPQGVAEGQNQPHPSIHLEGIRGILQAALK